MKRGRGGNPEPVERLIESFIRMPGIGRRSAERMALHVLRASGEEFEALAAALSDVRAKVRHCPYCWNLTDRPVCPVCDEPSRDRAQVMIVEQPKDLVTLESTGFYRGVYHVLGGLIDPLASVGPEDLAIRALIDRISTPGHNVGGIRVAEVILGLNPTLEGDGTMLYLAEQLAPLGVRVTRLARGIPSGSHLDFSSPAVLADAIAARSAMPGPRSE